MSIAESSVYPHGIDTDALNPLQRRAYDHLTSGDGDSERRLDTLRLMRAEGVFDTVTNEGHTRQLLLDHLEKDNVNCSAGKDRFRAAVLDEPDSPAPLFDQFRMVLADPSWLCTGSEQSDHSDCHGTLLHYEVHNTTTDRWESTYRAACQLATHRSRVTSTIHADYDHELEFDQSNTDVLEATPIFFSRPEPTPEPEAPRPAPWFADQRGTYTLEGLALRDVPAEQRFVTTEALLDAIAEYQAKYDLCNAGVGEFLDEFGLSLTKRYEVLVEFRDHEGHRHEILRFEVTGKLDPGDWLSDGDIDSPMNDTFEDRIREWLHNADSDAEVSFIKGVDTYYRINEIR